LSSEAKDIYNSTQREKITPSKVKQEGATAPRETSTKSTGHQKRQ